MFPISDATLSLSKIADYWSREIKPGASRLELLKLLESAWWREEFVPQVGASRLTLIRHLYRASNDFVFILPDAPDVPEMELEDGAVEVDLRPTIMVPSPESEAWNDADCALAYEDMAARPLLADLPAYATIFDGIHLSHQEFVRWLQRRPHPYRRPTFWAPVESENDASPRSTTAAATRRRGKRPSKRDRVIHVMRNEIAEGRLTTDELNNMLEKKLEERYGVSRDTARKAREVVLGDNSQQTPTNDK
jgi:hypothetical protein